MHELPKPLFTKFFVISRPFGALNAIFMYLLSLTKVCNCVLILLRTSEQAYILFKFESSEMS